MRATTDHPSNTLYRNEVRDFRHAVELVIDECIAEERRMPPVDPESWTEAMRDRHVATLEEYKAQARQAESIYSRIMDAAEMRVVEELREAGLDQFADALENADYSGLAI